jgi:hypothetical protein
MEAGAFARDIGSFNATAVGMQDGAGDGEAHARAFAALGAALAAVELLEDQRQIDRIDARTGVINGELQAIGGAPTFERDRGCGWGMTAGILQKMTQHAAEQVGIEPGGSVIILDLDGDLVGGQGFTRFLYGLIEQGATWT